MANLSDVITIPRLSRVLAKITPSWLGLGNVNNTADADKRVAFASTAGTAEKTNNSLVIRFKGGRTEGTNQWTYDASSGKSINVTAAGIGAVAVSQGRSNAGKILYVADDGTVGLIDIDTLRTMLNG